MLDGVIETFKEEVDDFSYLKWGVRALVTLPISYAAAIFANSYARVIAQAVHQQCYGPAPTFYSDPAGNARYYRSESDMINFAQETIPPLVVPGTIILGVTGLVVAEHTVKYFKTLMFSGKEKLGKENEKPLTVKEAPEDDPKLVNMNNRI